MFKTIFQRLFWTSTAIILLVISLVSTSMFGLLNRYVINERMNSAKKASKSIEYLTTEIAMQGFDSRLNRVYNSTIASWSMMLEAKITVINSSGSIFATTGDSQAIPEDIESDVLAGNVVSRNFSAEKRRAGYIIGIPISYQNEIIGGIFYFYPPNIAKSTIKEFSHMIFISMLVALFIALILVFIDSRRISRPLKHINNAVLEIASGKFEKRVDIPYSGEISQLASSFNYMADSLEQLEEMRTGFISDVSHELRTPMTSISGFISGILDGTIPKEQETEYLQIVLDESKRLQRLTNEMFEMSKMSDKEYKLNVTEFDFAETVRLCIIAAEREIDKKKLNLDVSFEKDTIKVLADSDAIKRVVINLLDNAVKFSKEGTTISINVCKNDKKASFEISNIGSGISEKDIPHIFERFYKSDRSRNREKSGAGLGLSFVKNIMDLHSQKISVKCEPTEGELKKTIFSFTLDLA